MFFPTFSLVVHGKKPFLPSFASSCHTFLSFLSGRFLLRRRRRSASSPAPMKIQPIDVLEAGPGRAVVSGRSRLRRLFDRHGGAREWKSPGAERDLSSLCLAKMVRNFLEETNEQSSLCGRSRFDAGDWEAGPRDEPRSAGAHVGNAPDVLKNLVACAGRVERKLQSYASVLVERSGGSRDNDGIREAIAKGLVASGYDAAVCRSRWDRCPSFPAGEHKYVDVMTEEGERLLIDVDFASEFEIARPTKRYRSVLQVLPRVFVGKADRLKKIVTLVSEAAAHSLKKKGLYVPPWRRSGYMSAKWLSPHVRITATARAAGEEVEEGGEAGVGPDRRSEKPGGAAVHEREKPVVVGSASVVR